MKVLHLIDSFGLGGAQTVVKGFFESQKENAGIFLYSLRKSKLMFEIGHSNVEIYNSYSLYSFFPLFKIWKLIRQNKIEILHCHLMRSKVFGVIIKLFLGHRIKLVFHEHGEIFKNATKFEDWLVKFIYNFSGFFLYQVIAVSDATKQCIINKTKISRNKIQVLHNFVDTEKFNKSNKGGFKELEDKLIDKSEGFNIGFVGRLEEVKGCKYFIKALPYLNFNYRAFVIGDGKQKISLVELSRELGISSKIIFFGFIKQIEWCYPSLDVLVVPSLSESFGLSAIEAQASGVAVLASDIPGLNEIVKDFETGLLFKTENEKEIAAKANLLYSDPVLKEKLIANGLTQAQKYSLSNYIKGLYNIYDSK